MNIDQYKKKKSYSTVLTGVLFAFFLILLTLQNIKDLDQTVILNDEFGYWSIAASLAGKDWKSLISTTPYYNFGYSLILFPLFFLNLPTYTIYKIAILINIVMLVFSYVFTFLCAKKMMKKVDARLLVFFSFLVNCYPNVLVQTQFAWTETLLYLLFWISFYLMLSIKESPKYWKIVAISLVLSYMFMVHQRTIGILIAALITLICMKLAKKISFKELLTVICIISVFIVGCFLVKNGLKVNLWENSQTSNMNDFSGQSSLLQKALCINGIKNISIALCGRLFYFMVSGTIFWYCGFKNIIKKIICNLKGFFRGEIPYEYVFVLLAFLSTVAIGLIGILEGFGRLDTPIYGRYIENVIGPILLMGITYIVQRGVSIHDFFEYFISVLITSIPTIYILSLITQSGFTDVCSVGLAIFFKDGNAVEAIRNVLIYALIINGVLVILMYNKKNMVKYIFAGSLLCICWFRIGDYVQNHTTLYYQNYKTENNLPIAVMLDAAEIDEIYYVKDEIFDEYCINAKYLQFWIPNIKINVVEDIKEVKTGEIWICEKGSNASQRLTKDAYILKESAEFYVCTDVESRIIDTLLEKNVLGRQYVGLPSSEFSNRDNSYEDQFISNGKAGLFLNSLPLDLNEGTYRAEVVLNNIEVPEKKTIGKFFVSEEGDSQILKEIDMTKKLLENGSFQMEFSCMNFSKIKFYIYLEEGCIIQLYNISVRKVENAYQIGEDEKEDIQELINEIDKIHPADIYYVAGNPEMKLKYSYVESVENKFSFNQTSKDEIHELKKEDCYLLLEREKENIFEYMGEFDCLMVNASYSLLVPRESNIKKSWLDAEKHLLNQGEFVDFAYLKTESEEKQMSNFSIELVQGTYLVEYNVSGMTGKIDVYSGDCMDTLVFDNNKKKMVKEISIKEDKESVEWVIQEENAKMPQCYIKRVAEDYSIFPLEAEQDIFYLGEKNEQEIKLLDDLQMGVYEFTFEIESDENVNVDIEFFKKVDKISKERINMVSSDSDKKKIEIRCKFNVVRGGLREVSSIIRNKGNSKVKVTDIRMKRIY